MNLLNEGSYNVVFISDPAVRMVTREDMMLTLVST